MENKFLKHAYAGGMQPHFPKNEAQVYMAKFTLDVANYCFKDYNSKEMSNQEIQCAKRLVELNNRLLG